MVTRIRTSLAKHWCFTINNPDLEVDSVEWNPATMNYLITANEVGTGGTKHIQGYVAFKTRKRLATVKKIMPRAHLEVMMGTPLQSSTYCMKDGDFTANGDLPDTPAKAAGKALKRNWDAAFEAAKNGDFESIPADMKIKYYHAFKRIRQDHPDKPHILSTTCGLWLVGESGCGKSRYARRRYPDYYDKPLNKWWDGYRNEPNILLDDVGMGHGAWLGPFLKRWTDHYPFPAEQKGTTIQIRPKQFIVTSQYTIDEIFSADGADMPLLDALHRRFTVLEPPFDDDVMTTLACMSTLEMSSDTEESLMASLLHVRTPPAIDLT